VVSQRIARVLLAVALRRWPPVLRDELHREWSAELHVLAGQRQHGRMVRYALSLALARPARRSVPVTAVLAGTWRVGRLVVVAPLAALASVAASLVAMNVVVGLLPSVPLATDLQLPLATLFTLCCAVLVARLGRRWAVTGAPGALLLAVTVPAFALTASVPAFSGGADKVAVHAPGNAVFFLGLAGVLVLVARYAGSGRRRAAWWIGVCGAVLAADVAVALTVSGVDAPPGEAPHLASAPVWLFTSLTDTGFGLPSPTGMQIFLIGDVTEPDPLLYLAFTALALGAVTAGGAPGHHAVPDGGPSPRLARRES
jgi:hypothetical protein